MYEQAVDMVTSTRISRFQKIVPAAEYVFSRTARQLFLIFALYLALPIVDLPLLGLSLSAPILFIVFAEVFLHSRGVNLKPNRHWITISYFFLLGLLLSLAGNALFSNIAMTTSDVLTLIRFGYWVLAFFTTIVVVSLAKDLKNIGTIIGCAILILAILRLSEAVFYGRWGNGPGPRLMTQNSYGIQFSTFIPFGLVLPLIFQGWKRNFAIVALILAFAAIAVNGSRSSWIAITSGAVLFAFIYAITQPKGVRIVQSGTIVLGGLVLAIVMMVPSSLLQPIANRFNTFDTLDRDKSYQVRLLMIQKGQRLFLESPYFGVGVGRFNESSTILDIPDVLSYHRQERFDRKSSHNSYIALLAESGLVGIVPFALLHLLLFSRGFPAAINLARRGDVWPIAFFSSYVGMSIHLWSLSGITGTTTWFVYGLVAGLIERHIRLNQWSTITQ